MTRLRDPGFWTTLVVLALAGEAMSIGWPLLRLSVAESISGPQSASMRALVDKSPAGMLAALDVVRAHATRDPMQREADLVALLRLSPLSPGAWLDLAIARRAAGEKTEDVVAALALSSMTGRNEALLMGGRVGFALPFWSALPPDARRALISDLVGGWSSIDSVERERLSAILQNARDNSGQEVRAALLVGEDNGPAIAATLMPAPKPNPDPETIPTPTPSP